LGTFFRRNIALVAALLCLCLLPVFLGNGYATGLLVIMGALSIAAMGLNLLYGYGGLVALGYGAFFGVGCYTAGLLSTKANLPFGATLPLSALAGALTGLILGYTCLRLRGLHFALGTWAFSELLMGTALNLYDVTGGPNGIPGIPAPSIGPIRASTDTGAFYMVLVLAGITYFALQRLVDSRWGRALEATREDDNVASMTGVNVFTIRVQAAAIAGLVGAVAGCFYAHYQRFTSPSVFAIWESVNILCMVVVGGTRNYLGSIAGAVLLVGVPELLRPVGVLRMLLYGVILLVTIVYRPQGLFPEGFSLKDWIADYRQRKQLASKAGRC
jgi:branched-chain amino acid transport system permease protein